jgi:hypothetical protein
MTNLGQFHLEEVSPSYWRVTSLLGEGLRQALGPSGGDRHQQTERVPRPAGRHRHHGPARAAMVAADNPTQTVVITTACRIHLEPIINAIP